MYCVEEMTVRALKLLICEPLISLLFCFQFHSLIAIYDPERKVFQLYTYTELRLTRISTFLETFTEI